MIRPVALALLCLALASCRPAELPPVAPVPVSPNADLDLSRPIEPSAVARFNDAPPELPAATVETTLCGEMTKKGLPCRNRVRGGGRCWRHRAPSK